jgi:hypothetical protein
MMNLNDTSWNRTRDPLACSAVAEVIAPLRALNVRRIIDVPLRECVLFSTVSGRISLFADKQFYRIFNNTALTVLGKTFLKSSCDV